MSTRLIKGPFTKLIQEADLSSYNLCADIDLSVDSNSDGVADAISGASEMTNLSVDLNGQHFTPASQWSGVNMSIPVALVVGHTYLIAAEVNGYGDDLYLEIEDGTNDKYEYWEEDQVGEYAWLLYTYTATDMDGLLKLRNAKASDWTEIIWRRIKIYDLTDMGIFE